MASKKPLLDQMRDNPRADWNIADIEKVCSKYDIQLQKPTHGSHYKAISRYIDGHETIPYHRPIKPYYIKCFVAMVHKHVEYEQVHGKGLK